jgi:hypothetical protein
MWKLIPPAALVAMLSISCGSAATGDDTQPGGRSEAGTPDTGHAVTAPDASSDTSHRRPDARTDAKPRPVDAGHEAAAPPVDAPPDVDNGAPSSVYPAPHPPLPQLVNTHGGPILTSPNVYLLFYPNYPYESELQTFAKNMTTATYWPTVTGEYGVGALTYAKTIPLTGQTPPDMITSAEIETWMGQQLASGAFGTPDPEGIYTIFYPETTTVTQPNPVVAALPPVASCVAFGGYHDNVAVTVTDGGTPQEFAYAVIPTCTTNVNDLTAAVSHEWVEASTDPFLTSGGAFNLTGGPDSAFFTVDADHAVWAILGGGEAGDLCEPEGDTAYYAPTDVGFVVQRIWSNELASESHDPCNPDLLGASFAAAPVLTTTETITSSLIGGTLVTQGLTIPAATSQTIEVDLYSDAETSGPITVTAADALSTYYGSYGLSETLAFQWDRTQGVNGDKLHLTITVTKESIIDGLHVFIITATVGSRQFVWPGLVLEHTA